MSRRKPRSVRHAFKARQKYNVGPKSKRTVDGILFDSQKEARYFERLQFLVHQKEVLFFLRQVPFHLPGSTRYVVDFVEFHADDTVHFVDVKGVETEVFKLKKRQVEDLFPVDIEVK